MQTFVEQTRAERQILKEALKNLELKEKLFKKEVEMEGFTQTPKPARHDLVLKD